MLWTMQSSLKVSLKVLEIRGRVFEGFNGLILCLGCGEYPNNASDRIRLTEVLRVVDERGVISR